MGPEELLSTLPRLSLGVTRTPVEALALEGEAVDRIWVKRDDRSADCYGGNKVRKLELLLGEARARQAERVVTAGAFGSHHALATTVYGRREGFQVTLVLCPQSVTEKVRRILRTNLELGAELRVVPRMELIPPALALARLRRSGGRPYVVPPGGSSVLGTFGYVAAGLELAEQVADGELPEPDWVHVACGTMGTAAGLAVGLAMGGLYARVKAVRVVGHLVANEGAFRRLLSATLRRVMKVTGHAPSLHDVMGRVHLDHGQLGEGYGKPTPAGEEARAILGERGVELDPTYTAKAGAGLLASVREEPQAVHLFWHTLSASVPDVSPGPLPPNVPERLRRVLEEE